MQDCVFCKIINREEPATVIFEDEKFMVFSSKFPAAETHILLIPKKHLTSIPEAEQSDALLLGELLLLAAKIAKQQNLLDYKLGFNVGRYQHVPHLHLHLLAGNLEGEKDDVFMSAT